jgi:hypothetical protein
VDFLLFSISLVPPPLIIDAARPKRRLAQDLPNHELNICAAALCGYRGFKSYKIISPSVSVRITLRSRAVTCGDSSMSCRSRSTARSDVSPYDFGKLAPVSLGLDNMTTYAQWCWTPRRHTPPANSCRCRKSASGVWPLGNGLHDPRICNFGSAVNSHWQFSESSTRLEPIPLSALPGIALATSSQSRCCVCAIDDGFRCNGYLLMRCGDLRFVSLSSYGKYTPSRAKLMPRYKKVQT